MASKLWVVVVGGGNDQRRRLATGRGGVGLDVVAAGAELLDADAEIAAVWAAAWAATTAFAYFIAFASHSFLRLPRVAFGAPSVAAAPVAAVASAAGLGAGLMACLAAAGLGAGLPACLAAGALAAASLRGRADLAVRAMLARMSQNGYGYMVWYMICFDFLVWYKLV